MFLFTVIDFCDIIKIEKEEIKIINIISNKNINIITLIISIIIFLFLNLFLNNFFKSNLIKNHEIISEKLTEDFNSDSRDQDEIILNKDGLNWYIEIPSIDLKAPIEETTEMDILNTAVGHFEDTALTVGNIGLAGHNRGYEKNYFENLKNVKIGDEIKYKYNDFEKIYIIDKIEIIKSTDWSYLENTEKNKITLITCVENKPDYRRCVQATEK